MKPAFAPARTQCNRVFDSVFAQPSGSAFYGMRGRTPLQVECNRVFESVFAQPSGSAFYGVRGRTPLQVGGRVFQ